MPFVRLCIIINLISLGLMVQGITSTIDTEVFALETAFLKAEGRMILILGRFISFRINFLESLDTPG